MDVDQMASELKDLADRSWDPQHGNRDVLAASAILSTMFAAMIDQPGRISNLALLVKDWNTRELRRHNAPNN